jgi:hypothetical protein
MAQGWSHGPVGAVIAAWPAVSLVGSYELLVWIIRTATAGELDREPAESYSGPQADQPGTSPRPAAAQEPDTGLRNPHGEGNGLVPDGVGGPLPVVRAAAADQASGPGWNAADQADQVVVYPETLSVVGMDRDINSAAAAAYRASVQAGTPLSERKLAGMFGKTSRRWARSRMAEARQSPVPS